MKLKKSYLWHFLVGLLSILLTYLFWLSRSEWVADMRLWRAFGDASFVLLFLTLIIYPLGKLWKPALKLLPWRRQLGIWFAITAIIHSFLILDGWVKWELMRFFGYEYVEQLGRYARLEPGFGLANVLGVIALFWAVILLATSSDKALNFLGGLSWKWLHYGAYIILYLISAHSLYFLFLHYTLSFHRPVPDPNWFRFPVLVMVVSFFSLQITVYINTILSRRKSIKSQA